MKKRSESLIGPRRRSEPEKGRNGIEQRETENERETEKRNEKEKENVPEIESAKETGTEPNDQSIMRIPLQQQNAYERAQNYGIPIVSSGELFGTQIERGLGKGTSLGTMNEWQGRSHLPKMQKGIGKALDDPLIGIRNVAPTLTGSLDIDVQNENGTEALLASRNQLAGIRAMKQKARMRPNTNTACRLQLIGGQRPKIQFLLPLG